MAKNIYHVEAHFQRARKKHVENWTGPARNMSIAMRRATVTIMRRRNVKRLRHEQITFYIEKEKPNSVDISGQIS